MDDPQTTVLIRRAQEGSASAFGELVDRHYDIIFRFAWKWCRDRDNAEDIAQQSCIKLAASLGQFRFQAAFTSWLYRLVVSCAQDWQRAQQRHLHAELTDEEPEPLDSRAEDSIYLSQLLRQLESLGEGMKETALLVHAEGLSHAEAGAILGVSESTISWRVHVMRKQLQRREPLASTHA